MTLCSLCCCLNLHILTMPDAEEPQPTYEDLQRENEELKVPPNHSTHLIRRTRRPLNQNTLSLQAKVYAAQVTKPPRERQRGGMNSFSDPTDTSCVCGCTIA